MSVIVQTDIAAAAARIESFNRTASEDITRTAVVTTSPQLDHATGNRVTLIREDLQVTGSFKVRGAASMMTRIGTRNLRGGVFTLSSGNHGRAIAHVAQQMGVPAHVFAGNNAHPAKIEAMRRLGATVELLDPSIDEATQHAIAEAKTREGWTYIPAYDHADIIAGQGTLAREVYSQVGHTNVVVMVVGGGGLLAGNAIAFKYLTPSAQIFGVEPEIANDVFLSLQRGERVTIDRPATIADAVRSRTPGALTFPIIQANTNGVLLVTEDEIRGAMKFMYDKDRMMMEPSAGAAVAALFRNEMGWRGLHIGVVICGGNIDRETFMSLIQG